MAEKSAIEWTDATWNPIVGCSVVSPGCTNCYAMKVAGARTKHTAKYAGLTKPSKAGPVWTGEVRFWEKALTDPLRWREPRRVFVNSMGDLFHEAILDEWIDRCFAVMALCPQHTFQVLTKRPERMREYMSRPYPAENVAVEWKPRVSQAIDDLISQRTEKSISAKMRMAKLAPLPNVWLGTSCERQQEADERIPLLLATPAAVRFVSLEPLLGAIDARRWLQIDWQCSYCRGLFTGAYQRVCPDCGRELGWSGSHPFNGRHAKHGGIDRGSGLDWVIVGGESGPHARPMNIAWVDALIDQCRAAGVPCFVKQLGAWPMSSGYPLELFDRKGGDWSEWPIRLQVRQFPEARS